MAGLDDRAIEVRYATEAKRFVSSLRVHTGSGAHPASCAMGPGGKSWPGRDTDHSLRVSRSRISRNYTFSAPPWSVAGPFNRTN
jgi:hypothetical protein